MLRMLLCIAASVLVVACSSGAKQKAALPTPDTGLSIAEISQQAVAAATARAAQAAAQAAVPRTQAAAALPQRLPAATPITSSLLSLPLDTTDLPPGSTQQTGPTPLSFTVNVGDQAGAIGGLASTYSVLQQSGEPDVLVVEVFRFSDALGPTATLQAGFASFAAGLDGQPRSVRAHRAATAERSHPGRGCTLVCAERRGIASPRRLRCPVP